MKDIALHGLIPFTIEAYSSSALLGQKLQDINLERGCLTTCPDFRYYKSCKTLHCHFCLWTIWEQSCRTWRVPPKGAVAACVFTGDPTHGVQGLPAPKHFLLSACGESFCLVTPRVSRPRPEGKAGECTPTSGFWGQNKDRHRCVPCVPPPEGWQPVEEIFSLYS